MSKILTLGLHAEKSFEYTGENDIEQIKFEVDDLDTDNLATLNPRENDFWERLRVSCLLPDSAAFAHDQDLKGE